VIVEAEDVHGPLETLAYDIDLAALGAVAAYGKTIYHAVEALEKMQRTRFRKICGMIKLRPVRGTGICPSGGPADRPSVTPFLNRVS
jgi:hypothetical protein